MPVNTNITCIAFICLKASQGLESGPSDLEQQGEFIVELEGC
jgi:hypothetical protein